MYEERICKSKGGYYLHKMEDALLAGSEGDGKTPPIGAKAYGGDLDDFTDEPFWNDENRWK